MGDKITFSDIFKSSFLEGIDSTISLTDVAITLLVTFTVGMFIFFIYKKTFQGVLYEKSFNISLVMISLVTSLVIMAVTSNIILSLGMVGALSIVRFRTAVKDPMDTVFMFWAIAVGIANGAGLILLAVTGSLIIGIIIIIVCRFDKFGNPYLLVVTCKDEIIEDKINSMIEDTYKKFKIKSKIVSEAGIEATYEVRIDENDTTIVNRISGIEGVNNAVLVSYNGDFTV